MMTCEEMKSAEIPTPKVLKQTAKPEARALAIQARATKDVTKSPHPKNWQMMNTQPPSQGCQNAHSVPGPRRRGDTRRPSECITTPPSPWVTMTATTMQSPEREK